ncbi:MAG: anthranilate phosphoribosyltransferase [Acidiferrobacteraceae bacterium]
MTANRLNLAQAATEVMREILGRIATGPELSKDLSQAEAAEGMRLVLRGQVDPVQAGIFLIALRMKRETDEENLGLLDALRTETVEVVAAVDEVVDIADPYDGYLRSLPPSPFLPAVLAAAGAPSVSHGLLRVGPKHGVTHRQVLSAAGVPVDLSPQAAAMRISDPSIGWAYVDQGAFCPALHALIPLRELIVKRPALSTVETLLGPIRGRIRTHLLTGYVHKPYPRIYALLARHAGFDSALMVRGVEGGVIPSLRQMGAFVYYHHQGEERSFEIHPEDLGITQTVRAAPLPGQADDQGEHMDTEKPFDAGLIAAAAAERGLDALRGAAGPTRDALIYAAAMCLFHLGRHDSPRTAAAAVRACLDDGIALARFSAAH